MRTGKKLREPETHGTQTDEITKITEKYMEMEIADRGSL